MERPTYGYLILSLDSLISCLIFLLVPHGISPVVWTIGMWIALRLVVLAGIKGIGVSSFEQYLCNDFAISQAINWAFPGRLAILALGTQISDLLAFAVYYYAPMQSKLVEEYLVYGIAGWFVLKGFVLLGIFTYKFCKDIQHAKKMDQYLEQDRSVYEQLL